MYTSCCEDSPLKAIGHQQQKLPTFSEGQLLNRITVSYEAQVFKSCITFAQEAIYREPLYYSTY